MGMFMMRQDPRLSDVCIELWIETDAPQPEGYPPGRQLFLEPRDISRYERHREGLYSGNLQATALQKAYFDLEEKVSAYCEQWLKDGYRWNPTAKMTLYKEGVKFNEFIVEIEDQHVF